MSDSAGVSWEGRHFEPNPAASDDGSAPERLIEALRRFRSRELDESDVVDALRASRLLIPLVTRLAEGGHDDHGVLVDKSQELSIVTVAGPDGRTVMPVFTSVAAMKAWDAAARPIPVDAVRVARAAAHEHTDIVVLDPTSCTEFAIRRPALSAIARQETWVPSYADLDVLDAFMAAAVGDPAVVAVQLAPGDPDARLTGPELVVHLTLAPGLDAVALAGLLSRLQQRWAEDELIATRVDSIAVTLDAR